MTPGLAQSIEAGFLTASAGLVPVFLLLLARRRSGDWPVVLCASSAGGSPGVSGQGRPSGGGPAGSMPRGTETVLVVEDMEGVRRFISVVLGSWGYKVLTAGNAEDALAIARDGRHRIDLLLTDIVMPRMNGHEMAGLMREAQPHLKVLYISGFVDDAAVRETLASADTAFLQKPFAPAVLAARVREILDGRAPE